ncbi:MAG: Holliday junction branch migration protein RuvA [Gemmatimonadales bacterium]
MIALIEGTLAVRDPAGIVIATSGGVGYQLEVPLGVFERLPAVGQRLQLHTELVVREDAWALFGFDTPLERIVFRRLLGASGVGARIALAMLSALGPDRTVRAIREKDLAILSSVPGIGKKKAERLVLELGDRLDDLPVTMSAGATIVSAPSADAVRALAALGYPAAAAEAAVRAAIDGGAPLETAALVRRALTDLTRM